MCIVSKTNYFHWVPTMKIFVYELNTGVNKYLILDRRWNVLTFRWRYEYDVNPIKIFQNSRKNI